MTTATRAAGFAQLEDVRLIGTRFQLRGVVGPDHVVRHRLTIPTRTIGDALLMFVARLELAVAADFADDHDDQTEDDSDRSPDLDLEADISYLVVYGVPDDFAPTDEELSAFAETSVRLTVAPYLREAAQSLASRAGIPNLVMPLEKVNYSPPEPTEATEAESD